MEPRKSEMLTIRLSPELRKSINLKRRELGIRRVSKAEVTRQALAAFCARPAPAAVTGGQNETMQQTAQAL